MAKFIPKTHFHMSRLIYIRGSRPGLHFITNDSLPVQAYHSIAILKESIHSLGLNEQHYTSHGFRIDGM